MSLKKEEEVFFYSHTVAEEVSMEIRVAGVRRALSAVCLFPKG